MEFAGCAVKFISEIKKMRTRKIALNVMTGIVLHIVNTISSLVVRKIFIQYIGADILGINSVYSSILSFLALSELGIGTTIAVCLYKPLAQKDYKSVEIYMLFLRKVYKIIGVLILSLGLLLTPFVPYIITTEKNSSYIYLSFVIYLCSVAFSYFFSYKRTLLDADQKAYIYQTIDIISKLILNIGFIVVIVIFKNYFIYLLVSLFCTVGENFVVSVIVDKQYDFSYAVNEKLPKAEFREIVQKLKGAICISLGSWMITGTDNIILSAFLGTVQVTFFSNYSLIINMLNAICSNFSAHASATMGNLIYTSRDRFTPVMNKILLVQHFLFSISTAGFIVVASDFVGGYFGRDFILDTNIVVCMAIVYYINGFSNGLESIRRAFGLLEQDRFFNLATPFLNIIVSIYGVMRWGMIGIIIGTIMCRVINKVIVLTWILNKYIAEFSWKKYLLQLVGSGGVTCVLTCIGRWICNRINIEYWLIRVIVETFIVGGIGIVLNVFLFGWRKEFKEFVLSFLRMKRESKKL